jgi:hypothetical protein
MRNDGAVGRRKRNRKLVAAFGVNHAPQWPPILLKPHRGRPSQASSNPKVLLYDPRYTITRRTGQGSFPQSRRSRICQSTFRDELEGETGEYGCSENQHCDRSRPFQHPSHTAYRERGTRKLFAAADCEGRSVHHSRLLPPLMNRKLGRRPRFS